MTSHQLIDSYLSFLAAQVAAGRNRPGTLTYYRRELARVRSLLPPDLAAADVRPYHLLEGPSRWHFHQAARRVWTWATKVGRLDRDPLRGHELPPAGRRERIPSRSERDAILAASSGFFREFLCVLWSTGARPGELRALRWCDVDLAEGVATLVEFKSKRRMKDAPPVRTLFLDEATVAFLRQLREDRSPRPGDAVFTGRHGQPLSGQAVRLNFNRACERAGVDQEGERLVPYSLRHGRATELTVGGMPTRLVADFLGHVQEKTTARYQHPRKRDVREALNRASRTTRVAS